MAKNTKTARQRVQNFTSLAEYEVGKVDDGHITVDDYDGYRLRRILHNGEWHFSVVDIVASLEVSSDARSYWKVTKNRLVGEGAVQSVKNCYQLKLPASDGKLYATDCADIETLFRIVQSIPSKKVEPLKQWLAEVAREWLRFKQQPSLAIDRAIGEYREQGRPNEWIDNRVQGISARNAITDEWENRDANPRSFCHLTNAMSDEAIGVRPKKHAEMKGLSKKDNLRDHMDETELVITTLSERAATEIMRVRDVKGYQPVKEASVDGAKVAGVARKALEEQLGRSVVSRSNLLPSPK